MAILSILNICAGKRNNTNATMAMFEGQDKTRQGTHNLTLEEKLRSMRQICIPLLILLDTTLYDKLIKMGLLLEVVLDA